MLNFSPSRLFLFLPLSLSTSRFSIIFISNTRFRKCSYFLGFSLQVFIEVFCNVSRRKRRNFEDLLFKFQIMLKFYPINSMFVTIQFIFEISPSLFLSLSHKQTKKIYAPIEDVFFFFYFPSHSPSSLLLVRETFKKV